MESAFSGGHSGFSSNLRWTSYATWGQVSLGMFWIWRNLDPCGSWKFDGFAEIHSLCKTFSHSAPGIALKYTPKEDGLILWNGSEELLLKWL